MNIDSIVCRLQKVNNQLMTISSLRKIQDMSDERGKPCKCAHHRSTSGSRSAGKCNSNVREKKKSRCSCRQRPKLCLCSHGSDDQMVTTKSKKSDFDDHSKYRSEKSSNNEEQKRLFDDTIVKTFTKEVVTEKSKKSEFDEDTKWRFEKLIQDEKQKGTIDITIDRTFQEQIATEKSKKSDFEDDEKWPSQKSSQHEKQKDSVERETFETLKDHGVTEKLKKTNVEKDSKGQAQKTSENDKPKEFVDQAVETLKVHTDKSRKSDVDKVSQYEEIPDRDVQKTDQAIKPKKTDNRDLQKRNLELEDKLRNMDCSMSCLKQEGEKQAACFKDALEKVNNEAKLASRSRNLVMDLAKQSREQTDLVRASRDKIISQINFVKCNNSKLECECNELKCKLKGITENEAKKCAEVDEKINRIKCVFKQREIAITCEKNELKMIVDDLTNNAKIQKKRICDLTSVCTKQRDLLRDNENSITTKIAQLTETEERIKSMSCICRQMQERIDDLECRLNEEIVSRENLQKELNECQDNCNCELRIKDKIIEDQVETIKKLKKLLQDSEKMAHQAACEFESLRDELCCLKQSNKSLRIALDEAEYRMSEDCETNEYCDRCNILEAQIDHLNEQKEKAMMAARFAAEKLCKITTDYELKLDREKQHCDEANSLAERQETEIQLLKKEILCVKEFRSRRSIDYIVHQ